MIKFFQQLEFLFTWELDGKIMSRVCVETLMATVEMNSQTKKTVFMLPQLGSLVMHGELQKAAH
jgi:hypothetical protein